MNRNQDGMSITGSKFGMEKSQTSRTPMPINSARGPGSKNPFFSPRDMTIQEVVAAGVKKPSFGMNEYTTPSNEML